MKSRAYMKGAEFKARQGWLPFVDAVGMALQLLEPVKTKAWAWFKEWKKARWNLMAIRARQPEQLNLWPAGFQPDRVKKTLDGAFLLVAAGRGLAGLR